MNTQSQVEDTVFDQRNAAMEQRRILVVDDESSIRDSLSILLSESFEDFSIHTAASAEEAIELFDDAEIDLLITDLKLPKMDGLSLARSALTTSPSTRSILMTAYGSEEIHDDAYKLGCSVYIEKPFDIDELLVSIGETLFPRHVLSTDKQAFLKAVNKAGMERRDVTVRLTQGQSNGVVFMRDGRITFAEFDGLKSYAALVAMLACQKAEVQLIPSCPEIGQSGFAVPWQSLRDAAKASAIADQFRILRSSLCRSLEDILDGRVSIASEENSAFNDILRRFREHSGAFTDSPEEVYRQDNRHTLLKRSLDSEYFQRQAKLRTLVNAGVEHFRADEFEKAKRCWLGALRVDPGCKQARRNLSVVRKVLQGPEES